MGDLALYSYGNLGDYLFLGRPSSMRLLKMAIRWVLMPSMMMSL